MRGDLDVVSSLAPDLVILDIGTNDLAASGPEVVAGSRIEELVNLLLDTYSVRAIVVCEVIPRIGQPAFNAAVPVLISLFSGGFGPIL